MIVLDPLLKVDETTVSAVCWLEDEGERLASLGALCSVRTDFDVSRCGKRVKNNIFLHGN